MPMVPALVRGVDGRPVHHGIVERSYERLRAIIQMYVLYKQEDRSCVCCTFTHTPSTVALRVSTTCYTCGHRRTQQPSVASVPTITQHIIKPRSNIPPQDIKFGDASDVVRANKHRITYDEFEYDCTSLRRTAPPHVIPHQLPSIHSHHVPSQSTYIAANHCTTSRVSCVYPTTGRTSPAV